METKICYECGKNLFLTEEYFRKRKGTENKFFGKCKACVKIYMSKYRQDNSKVLIEKKKQYNDKHVKEIAEANRLYRQNNTTEITKTINMRSKVIGGFKQCTNCGELLKATAEYFGTDKRCSSGLTGKCRKCRISTNKRYKHIRKAKDKLSVAMFTKEDWEECLKYFNHKDAYTGLSMEIISQDHVIPLCKGGSYIRQNIIPCEKSINSSKNDNDMEKWYKKQEFFNEERLNRIYKWIEFKNNAQQLKFI